MLPRGMMRSGSQPATVVLLLGLALVGLSCSSNSACPTCAIPIESLFTAIEVAGAQVQATFNPGAPPAAGNGPSVTVSGLGNIVPGGQSSITVTSGSGSFLSTIIVALQGTGSGYYTVPVPNPSPTVVMIATAAKNAPVQAYTIQVSGGGTYDTAQATVVTPTSESGFYELDSISHHAVPYFDSLDAATIDSGSVTLANGQLTYTLSYHGGGNPSVTTVCSSTYNLNGSTVQWVQSSSCNNDAELPADSFTLSGTTLSGSLDTIQQGGAPVVYIRQ